VGGNEFRGIILGLVDELPARQRLVARLYIKLVEEFGPRDVYWRLTDAVREASGHAENVHTVKNLWHAARASLAAGLERLGYAGPVKPTRTRADPANGRFGHLPEDEANQQGEPA
jgi:hypothetical protein